MKLADQSVFQFLVGLGLLFVTIAIPVELDGSWVTILWTFEATALCWIAFKNNRQLYLAIAMPMVCVAVLSLMQDWVSNYPYLHAFLPVEKGTQQPFLNLNFYFSLIVSGCFGYISWLSFQTFPETKVLIKQFFRTALPFIFVFTLYFTLFAEIHYSWDQLLISKSSIAEYNGADNIKYFQHLSLIIYSLLYVAILLVINKQLLKSEYVAQRLALFGILAVAVFLLYGLMIIGGLRDSYLELKTSGLTPSLLMVNIRYICFAAVGMLFISAWRTVRVNADDRRIFSSLFNITLLAIICNEFVHWMDIAGYQNQYKLGLSLIWGVYALVLIFVGITTRQKHLRVGSIILFALTLIKLFFYDLSSLSTISKTIVLVILGIILLVVSFLYTKYKHIILGDDIVNET